MLEKAGKISYNRNAVKLHKQEARMIGGASAPPFCDVIFLFFILPSPGWRPFLTAQKRPKKAQGLRELQNRCYTSIGEEHAAPPLTPKTYIPVVP